MLPSRSRNGERCRVNGVLPYGSGASSVGWKGTGLDDPPVKTALEAKLNEARRAQRSRDLRRETQAFLLRLAREREDRVSLEAWAATIVQAVFRGFLVRPRPRRPHARKAITAAESDRRLVADLQALLMRAGLPTVPGLGPDGRKAPEIYQWGQQRIMLSRGGGRARRRVRLWRNWAFEDKMATRITRVVRGFIHRRRFLRHWTAWDQSRREKSAICIQNLWRRHCRHKDWCDRESAFKDRSIVKMQALWRGGAYRKVIASRKRENALWERKIMSAKTIQASIRRRIVMARYGARLTLRAERREREARVAAEAFRRRWNHGGRASFTAVPSKANGA